MQSFINKAVQDLLNQLHDKPWQYPLYQLVLSTKHVKCFAKYNLDGSYDNLMGEDVPCIDYLLIIR
jgi:hypothetical protein